MAKTPTKRPTVTLTIGTREWVFSEAILEHAETLLDGNRITQTGHNIWTTEPTKYGNVHQSEITTILHTEPDRRFAFISCTCPHSKQSGFGRARCSHVYAAITQLGATR